MIFTPVEGEAVLGGPLLVVKPSAHRTQGAELS